MKKVRKGEIKKTRNAKNAYIQRTYPKGIEFQVYDLSKQGMSSKAIAQSLNISRNSLKNWETRDDMLGDAMRKGRKYTKDKSNHTNFQDYVFDQLPERLRTLWNEITACEKDNSGLARIEAILNKNGKRARQHLFLYALVVYNFSINKALSRLGIPSATFKYWAETDDDFIEIMDALQFHKQNFCEDALMKLIEDGHPHAILFANKTLNKDRGYGTESRVKVSVTGGVSHTVGLVDIDALDLDIDTRKQLLAQVREKKRAQVLEIPYEETE